MKFTTDILTPLTAFCLFGSGSDMGAAISPYNKDTWQRTIHYPGICDCKSGLSAVCLVFFDLLRVA